ncbi:HD-GYP domain-containing protein [Wukongibacter sp. M2B1]|uniref:HD-GYP domain-containing protein n=1 Tax=Wukongibacter sp. M2B1 TaxID=3088895 RepID=UPI003D795BB7
MIHGLEALSEDFGLYHDIIECLVGALEAKDLYTRGHSMRVGDMSYQLAKEIGIRGEELEMIHIAAHLHDIGKIGIPDKILNKKGKLTSSEWKAIKRHPEIGSNILERSDKLRKISKLVLHHHERWDGKGYPSGLKGKDIPLGSRIIAICDSIDAMTSQRSYRKSIPWNLCREEIKVNKGTQFDPFLVEAANGLWEYWKNEFYCV